MSEMNEVTVVENKNFFEVARDGIADAPTESKILAGVGALVLSVGIGIASFFVGKAVGADEFDPTKKDNKKDNNQQNAQQTQPADQPQQQTTQDQPQQNAQTQQQAAQ